MKYLSSILFLFLLTWVPKAFSQKLIIDKVAFFADTSILNVVIETDVNKLINKKLIEGEVFPAKFIVQIPDSLTTKINIDLEARGHLRREICYMPPLKIKFDKDSMAATAPLKSLKLVAACNTYGDYDQYVLKEFLIYKIYNLLTDKSLRVRLLNVEFKDNKGGGKSIQSNAFLIEDLGDAAKRNKCREWKGKNLPQETTQQEQMTLVAIFQYMIGNTDWSVSVGHNIKLIITRSEEVIKPYPVAYDFDLSGLVNTDYSYPDPILNIQSVRERLYRGYTKSMDEINQALQIFNAQKDSIYALINNFSLLSSRNKKNMISYLDDFYSTIKNPKKVKSEFISNARK